ncbi:MAG: glutathione S-transferase family protein [Polyangiales bacterium]
MTNTPSKQTSSLTYYHAPHSRSSSGVWLLEELGVPYQVEIVDIRGQGGVPEAYRRIHPNKKVPALAHEGVVITESSAIAIYLGDTFGSDEVAPKPGDARRGPYLKWQVWASSVFDPCVTAKLTGWEYDPSAVSFGSFADLERHLDETLAASPYLLGDAFTLADLRLAANLGWVMHFGLFADRPRFAEYVARVTARPSYARYLEKGG